MPALNREVKLELKKVWSINTTILILIFILLISGFSVVQEINSPYGDNWHSEVTQKISESKELILKWRSDEAIDGELIESEELFVKKMQYHLDHDINVNGGIFRVTENFFSTSFFLVIISIIITSKIIYSEYNKYKDVNVIEVNSNKNIIFVTKIIAQVITMVMIFMEAIVISMLVGIIFLNKNGLGIDLVTVKSSGEIAQSMIFISIFNLLVISAMQVMAVSSLTVVCSALFKKKSIAIIISFLVWSFGGILIEVVDFIPSKFKFLFPPYCFNYFKNLIYDGYYWNNPTFLIMIVSTLIYSFIFIRFSCYVFNKKLIKL